MKLPRCTACLLAIHRGKCESTITDCDGRNESGWVFGQGFDSPQVHEKVTNMDMHPCPSLFNGIERSRTQTESPCFRDRACRKEGPATYGNPTTSDFRREDALRPVRLPLLYGIERSRTQTETPSRTPSRTQTENPCFYSHIDYPQDLSNKWAITD